MPPRSRRAASVVEYVLVVALAVVVLAAGVTLLGGSVGALADEVGDLLGAGVTTSRIG